MTTDSPWRVRANFTVGDWRAVGGHLAADPQRLTFRPHAFDRATGGGDGVDVALVDVVAVEKAPVGGDVFAGGLRPRMRVRLVDGTELLFVVNRLARRIEELTALVEDARRAPPRRT